MLRSPLDSILPLSDTLRCDVKVPWSLGSSSSSNWLFWNRQSA
ncbi:hypothetical protein LEMLEM_LOCUS10688, partial [Lemmus lemmus]